MHHPLPVASSVIANMALVQVGSARFGFPDDLYRSVSSFERKSKCLETVIIHCDKVRKMCVHKARAPHVPGSYIRTKSLTSTNNRNPDPALSNYYCIANTPINHHNLQDYIDLLVHPPEYNLDQTAAKSNCTTKTVPPKICDASLRTTQPHRKISQQPAEGTQNTDGPSLFTWPSKPQRT